MGRKKEMDTGGKIVYGFLGALAALAMFLGAIDSLGGAVVLQFFGGIACLVIAGILGHKAS